MRAGWAAVAVACGALMAAGCGGDEDAATASDATPRTAAMPVATAPSITPAATPDSREEVLARAEAARKAQAARARAQREARVARAKAERAKQARARAAARAEAQARRKAEARASARRKAQARARALNSFAEGSPERILAIIDHGVSRGDDPRIRPYRAAINKLIPMCGADRMRIADRAVSIRNALQEQSGIEVTSMEVLRGVGTVSEADVGWPCEQYFAAWAVVRESEG